MAVDLHERQMPKEGLWRAGRWADVGEFPPPVRPIHSMILSESSPLLDGYRWEDAFGRFATAKLSESAEAAIGRTIARYRRRVIGGISLLDHIKGFLTSGTDNPAEPELVDNRIPRSYFEDAHILRIDYDEALRFIDIDHQRTLDTLNAVLSGSLESMGGNLGSGGISQQRDRRVTRLITATLHDLCSDGFHDHVAGIRYKAPDKNWDAYVLWDSPARVDIARATSVEPIFPDDSRLRAAAVTLGLVIPEL